jgi:hypothetical protein
MHEDGSHNAEGLMVTPNGSAYVVTKLALGSGGAVMATGPSIVYRVPFSEHIRLDRGPRRDPADPNPERPRHRQQRRIACSQ